MEPRNSTMLESSGDNMLIATVKSMVTRNGDRNDSETEEDFFLMSQVSNADRYVDRDENVKEEEAAHKQQTILDTVEFADLCRICANASDHMIPIFEGEGMEHELRDKILKYLPIHVSESDTLPLQLCYHCASTLLAWHELSEGCLDADRRLLEIQQMLQNKHQYYNPASLDNLEMPVPIATTTATTTPSTTITTMVNSADSQPDCQLQVDIKTDAQGAEEIDKSNRSCGVQTPFRVFLDTQSAFWKPYRKRCWPRTRPSRPSAMAEDCDSVWIAVMDVAALAADQPVKAEAPAGHLRNNDPTRSSIRVEEEEERRRVEEEEERRRVAPANYEPQAYRRVTSNVERDEKSQDDRMITDNDPADSMDILPSEDKESLRETINRDDDDGGKTFSSLQKQESFQCAECGKCFKLKDSYLRHMRIHKNERPFTCHVCGKQFRDSGGLTRHLKDVHAKLKNFTCDLCGRSFASKATREDHRRTHTGERPFVCDSCGKTFKSKASLYIHSKLHTDEFPHACSYCGKRFRRRQEVVAHVTTHTGEKNHECDVCAKKFRVKSELARHRLIHSEEKPFVCIKCGLAFRQKRYLNNHVKSRHSESLRAS